MEDLIPDIRIQKSYSNYNNTALVQEETQRQMEQNKESEKRRMAG